MLVWFATLASKKEIEARLDALEATVAAQNATIAALRDAISSRVAPPLRTGRHFKFIGVALARGGGRDADDEGGGH